MVSRKDLDGLEERHVLHSLGIAKVVAFKPGSDILDIGTGGGFPGIPLAIMFPETRFLLTDSIGKKIKVVDGVIQALDLQNTVALNVRAETIDDTFDFIISRAVAPMADLQRWGQGKVNEHYNHKLKNGILSLKGGDLSEELGNIRRKARIYELHEFFTETFFETKKVVYLPLI